MPAWPPLFTSHVANHRHYYLVSFLRIGHMAEVGVSLRTEHERRRRSWETDACILTTARSATPCARNTDQTATQYWCVYLRGLHYQRQHPGGGHGQAHRHPLRRMDLAVAVGHVLCPLSLSVHKRASPTSTCLSVWRFEGGRARPSFSQTEREVF